MDTEKIETDEKIGYRKPPSATRFKPGVSGNLKGRPKGSQNFHKLLNLLMDEKVEVTAGNHKIKLSKKHISVLKAVNSAVSGDLKSLQVLLPHLLIAEAKSEEQSRSNELSQSDQSILESYIKQQTN